MPPFYGMERARGRDYGGKVACQAQYQYVVEVLDMLGRLGITQVGLATKAIVK